MSAASTIHAPDWDREIYQPADLAMLLEIRQEITDLTREDAVSILDELLALGRRGFVHGEPSGHYTVVRLS